MISSQILIRQSLLSRKVNSTLKSFTDTRLQKYTATLAPSHRSWTPNERRTLVLNWSHLFLSCSRSSSICFSRCAFFCAFFFFHSRCAIERSFLQNQHNQVNSAFHPFRVGKWVVIHVITWITGLETIKQQIWAAYGCLVIGQSVGARLADGLYAVCCSVCDTTAPLQLQFPLVALYKLVLCLELYEQVPHNRQGFVHPTSLNCCYIHIKKEYSDFHVKACNRLIS